MELPSRWTVRKQHQRRARDNDKQMIQQLRVELDMLKSSGKVYNHNMIKVKSLVRSIDELPHKQEVKDTGCDPIPRRELLQKAEAKRLYPSMKAKIAAKAERSMIHEQRVAANQLRRAWAVEHGPQQRPWWYSDGALRRPDAPLPLHDAVQTPVREERKSATPSSESESVAAALPGAEHGGGVDPADAQGRSAGLSSTATSRTPQCRPYEVGDNIVVVTGFRTDSKDSVRVREGQKGEIRHISPYDMKIKFEGVEHKQRVKNSHHRCIDGDGFVGW